MKNIHFFKFKVMGLALLSCLLIGVESQIHQYQIYINPYWPLTICQSASSSLLLDSNQQMTSTELKIISGYEVQLVLQNIRRMVTDKYYTIQLTCVTASNFNTMLASDVSTTTRTVLGIGAQRITQTALSQGIQPTMPIYLSSLKLIYQQDQYKSYWILFRPLSVGIVFGYLGLGLVVSLLVWAMEERIWKQPKIRHFSNILEIGYDVFSSLFFTNLIHLQKVSSKIILWFFWFTTFVYIVIYQANLTLKVSESYTISSISSMLSGLQNNLKFGVFDVFQSQIVSMYPSYSSQIASYATTTNTQTTIKQLFLDLDSNKIDGFLLETPLADYYCSLYCTDNAVDEIIYSFNYVTMFASGTSTSIIQNYNSMLSKSLQAYPLSSIKSQVFDVTGLSPCKAQEEQIKTSELAGVWIILGITFGITLLIWGIQKCFKTKQIKTTNYYYQFQNQKNRLFEEKLKQSIKSEVSEILHNYSFNFYKQIDIFERNLMLQDIDEKSVQNMPLSKFTRDQLNEGESEIYKRPVQKQND